MAGEEEDLDCVSEFSGDVMCDGPAPYEIESIAMLSFAVDNMSMGSFGQLPSAESQNSAVYEGSETHVYRLRNSDGKYGGHAEWVAAKILLDQFPDPGQILRLSNEYSITKHLSDCNITAARAALKQEEIDSCHAIFLEWIEGITLRQWIQAKHPADVTAGHSRDFILNAIRLAWAISAALSEVHRAGIAHNDFSAENILLCGPCVSGSDASSDGGLTPSVKIIDFGMAVRIAEDNAAANASTNTNTDLLALGALYFEIFSGSSPFQNDPTSSHGTPTHQARLLPLTALSTILTPKVPPLLSEMIFKLMRLRPGASYFASADEVNQNLYLMLVDPNQFAFGDISTKRIHQPDFVAGKLYGRAKESSMLQSAYNRVVQSENPSEIVLVHGYSGAGKTVLVREVCRSLVKNCGYFISGKFDQLKQTELLSAIISAFTEYCDQVIQGDATVLSQVRSSIEEALGSEGSFLTSLIPKLNHIITVSNTDSSQKNRIETQFQFIFMFRNFVRAIVSPSRPLILFLDDIQWADDASLDLIEALFTDNSIKHVLFIASFRSNELKSGSSLDMKLNRILLSGVATTKILVDDISSSVVNELISDKLCLPQTSTSALAEIVHHKTGGNILFVTQCLKTLCDEGLLYFSIDSDSWQWDIQTIESKGVANDALELMLRKIKYLPEETQNALKLVACLGSCCEESTLRLITTGNTKAQKNNGIASVEFTSLINSLSLAVHEGLMDKKGSTFKFAHDQIQYAAYSLIEERERGNLHLTIGNLLLRNKDEEIDSTLFLTVDQLNLGSDYITDQGGKDELARLCLKAGKKALSSYAFQPAASYLKSGIACLAPKHWEEQYEFSLDLYNHYTRTQFCTAQFEEMGLFLNEILVNAKCFRDKLSTYSTLVSALGAQNKLDEAIEIGLDVLKELGEAIPAEDVDNSTVLAHFGDTKEMLRGKTAEEILAMDKMENHVKCIAMTFLDQMILYSYTTKQELLPLFAFRMVQLSLSYGISKESPFGFAAYAFLLCGAFGDIKGGYNYGQLALQLLERNQSCETLPRVYAAIYGCVSVWSTNIHLSLDPHKTAVKLGLRLGDTEYATVNAQIYAITGFQAGVKLDTLDEECKCMNQQAKECKQDHLRHFLLLTWETIINLKNASDDPTQLTGKTANEEEFFSNVHNSKVILLKCFVFWHRMILAYIFGNYDLAAEMAEKSRDIDKLGNSKFEMCTFVFYDSLISIALALKTNESKWVDLAKNGREKMRLYAVHGSCNCQHKLDLIEAEYAALMGDNRKAQTMYDLSIAGAIENGFLNEEALGYERAAIFYLQQKNVSKSSAYYGRAHNAYLEWGARAKADALCERCPF